MDNPRLYGIPQISDKKMALAAALTYWVFRCRDRQKSPAMGLKTWEFLQSSVQNAVIPARTLEDYLEGLANKLVINHLKPKELTFVLQPNQTIQRLDPDGTILELEKDQDNLGLQFQSWRQIMDSLKIEGITDRHILQTILKYPHLVVTYVRVRFEEDKAIGEEESLEPLIEVTADAI